MLERLRRSRLLVLTLLGASPAVGGTLGPVLHPCPVDAPWLAQQSRVAATGHADHAGVDESPRQAPDQGGHEHQTCHCPGTCSAATAAAPAAEPSLEIKAGPRTVSRVATGTASRLPRPRFLLPPSTAPPLA